MKSKSIKMMPLLRQIPRHQRSERDGLIEAAQNTARTANVEKMKNLNNLPASVQKPRPYLL